MDCCSDQIEFIKNNKGGLKLLANGFAYVKKRELKNSIQWECELRRKKQECNTACGFNGQIRESDRQQTHGPNL